MNNGRRTYLHKHPPIGKYKVCLMKNIGYDMKLIKLHLLFSHLALVSFIFLIPDIFHEADLVQTNDTIIEDNEYVKSYLIS